MLREPSLNVLAPIAKPTPLGAGNPDRSKVAASRVPKHRFGGLEAEPVGDFARGEQAAAHAAGLAF